LVEGWGAALPPATILVIGAVADHAERHEEDGIEWLGHEMVGL